MTRFSANLGFLWNDLPLAAAIRAARAAGFDAVECHWPYAVDPGDVRSALEETGLPMLLAQRTAWDADANLVEWTESKFRGDRFRYMSRQRIDWPGPGETEAEDAAG